MFCTRLLHGFYKGFRRMLKGFNCVYAQCMRVNVHVNIYIYVYVGIYIYMYTYMHNYIHTCMHAYIYKTGHWERALSELLDTCGSTK